MPSFSIEETLGTQRIFGIDEAGRGPWCGPVVAACVCWPDLKMPEELKTQIKDSKKLTGTKREVLFEKIMTLAVVGIGQASAEEIDRYNILNATFMAMHRALEQITSPIDYVLIDGNRLPKNWEYPCQAVIKGDDLSFSIAAASIIAKVTRDRIMTDLSKAYPAYKWDKNAGYGTKDHILALQEFGITPHHRRSYAPIQKILQEKTLAI